MVQKGAQFTALLEPTSPPRTATRRSAPQPCPSPTRPRPGSRPPAVHGLAQGRRHDGHPRADWDARVPRGRPVQERQQGAGLQAAGDDGGRDRHHAHAAGDGPQPAPPIPSPLLPHTPSPTLLLLSPPPALHRDAATTPSCFPRPAAPPPPQVMAAILKDPSDKTQISLLYANQTESDILVRDMLDELAAKHASRLKARTSRRRPPPRAVTADAADADAAAAAAAARTLAHTRMRNTHTHTHTQPRLSSAELGRPRPGALHARPAARRLEVLVWLHHRGDDLGAPAPSRRRHTRPHARETSRD